MTKWADLVQLFKAAVDKFGRVDIVYANAGERLEIVRQTWLTRSTTLGIGPKDDYFNLEIDSAGDPKEPSQSNIVVNVIGLINTAVLAIRHMKEQQSGGSIILTSSATGKDPASRLL